MQAEGAEVDEFIAAMTFCLSTSSSLNHLTDFLFDINSLRTEKFIEPVSYFFNFWGIKTSTSFEINFFCNFKNFLDAVSITSEPLHSLKNSSKT